MSKLQEVVEKLSKQETKLFNGIFSHQNLDFYDAYQDDLDTSISALIGSTYQVFSLHIEPAETTTRHKLYHVEVKYFKEFRFCATVPAELLLDYLLRAKIIIKKDSSGIVIEYDPSV